MDSDSEYSVGYRRPPKHSQFKKGQSGNPKNRPARKSPSFGELIDEAFRREVTIREKGISKRVSILELMTRKLVDAAAQGKSEALDLLMELNDYAKKRGDGPATILRVVDPATGAFIRDEFPRTSSNSYGKTK